MQLKQETPFSLFVLLDQLNIFQKRYTENDQSMSKMLQNKQTLDNWDCLRISSNEILRSLYPESSLNDDEIKPIISSQKNILEDLIM